MDIDISDAHVKIANENTNRHSSSSIDVNENEDEQNFQSAQLILKIYIVSIKKLAEELPRFLLFTSLTSMDFQVNLQNV